MEPQWSQRMAGSFDRASVEATLRAEFPRFSIRRSPECDPYRVPTKYMIGNSWQQDMREVREALGPSVQVVSSGGNSDDWRYVDFLSAEAGKLSACEFVMQHLDAPPHRTLVCGDSGNDEDMYHCAGVRCVAVGNALPELVEALEGIAEPGPGAVKRGQVFRTKFGSSVLYAEGLAASAITEALGIFWPQDR